MHAKFCGFLGTHFGNQTLHKNLGTARVELFNHGPDLAVLRFRGRDDQRIGGRVGLNLTAGGGLGVAGIEAGASTAVHGAVLSGAGGARSRGVRCTRLRGERCAQCGGQFGGIGIFQVDHMDVAAGRIGARVGGVVQLSNQGAGQA